MARVDNISYTLGYHSEYLRLLKEVEWGMVEWNGWKRSSLNPSGIGYILAIMAVKQYDCTYLARNLELEWLQRSNTSLKLRTFNDLPRKLQKLNRINYLMANQPWALSCEDFKEAMFDEQSPNDAWQFEELSMALLLFAHYHAKCSMARDFVVEEDFSCPKSQTF